MQPTATSRGPRHSPITIQRRTAALVAFTAMVSLTTNLAAQDIGSQARMSAAATPRLPPGVSETVATIDGVKVNYKVGGQGPVIVLLHGFAETSHMWMPLMPLLTGSRTVIVPDLRGAGNSERTVTGYDKKTLATEVRGLVHHLGRGKEPVTIVGHDIGLMVAYAYAAQYPNEVGKLVLMDAFLPGVGDWKNVWLARDLWHFHFSGRTPEALVKGRERIYLDHFWNDFAADETKSIPESDRQLYAAAYGRDDSIRATFQYFSNFERDAKDFATFAETKLPMSVLVLTGEKASGTFLIDQARLVATNVRGVVIKAAGHWLMEEAPQQVLPELVTFITDTRGVESEGTRQRLTPHDLENRTMTGAGAGTSGVSGIQTTVLKGDPTQAGMYTIQLKIPAGTRIEAHGHPDDRIATVISGTWYFGYGDQFASADLKALPPGSFYTEPPSQLHFAQTGETPVVLQITGMGPTGTHYSGSK